MASRFRVLPTHGILAVLILTGCATAQNTPQQDYTYEMGANCEKSLGHIATKIEKVNPDGSYTIRAYGSEAGIGAREYPLFFGCMKEQFKTYPYLDWLKAHKRESQQPLVATGTSVTATPGTSGPITAPIWKIGDEWQYAYKSPTDSGTYVWSVNRVELLDGIEHYVIKTGTREILFRVSDLASSLERVDGAVVSRETPSRLSYAWPLTVGKTWEQSNRQERPVDRTTLDRNSVWIVDADETTTVLAGTFRTMKITWRNKNTGALNYEMWYAPDVKQWVKIREILSNGQRERELASFKLK